MPVDERKYYNKKLIAGTLKSEWKNNSKMSVGDIVKKFPTDAVGEVLGEVFDDFGGGVVAEIAGEILGGIGEKMREEDAQKLKKRLEDNYGDKKKRKKKNKKKKETESSNTLPERETEEHVQKPVIKVQEKEDFSVKNMTVEKLQNAVIWSEVLGEPVCRRRRSRRR